CARGMPGRQQQLGKLRGRLAAVPSGGQETLGSHYQLEGVGRGRCRARVRAWSGGQTLQVGGAVDPGAQGVIARVYGAINAVTSAFAQQGIAKDRFNTADEYAYRSIDDVLVRLSPLLAEHRLCVLP